MLVGHFFDLDAHARLLGVCVLEITQTAAWVAPRVDAAGPAKWPTRLRRSKELEGVPGTRALAEEADRAKWSGVIAEVVREAGLPLAIAARELGDTGAILGRCAQGLRARTLRRRARDWAKARRYFLTAWGAPWPQSPVWILDFVQALAAGGRDSQCA